MLELLELLELLEVLEVVEMGRLYPENRSQSLVDRF